MYHWDFYALWVFEWRKIT
ncbi:hypothetical protein ACVD45_12195 [Staphylococcus aureus]